MNLIHKTVWQWLKSWIKNWLFYKASTAFAVYGICSILLILQKNAKLDISASQIFNEIFKLSSNPDLLKLIYFLGAVAIASLIVQFRKDKHKEKVFQKNIFSIAISSIITLFGIILVPLIFSLSYLNVNNEPITSSVSHSVILTLLAYVSISAALDYLIVLDSNPPEQIAYVFRISKNLPAIKAINKTKGELAECLRDFIYLDDPRILSHSKDNHIALVVGIKLSLDHWDIEDLQTLRYLIKNMEEKWQNEKDCFFSRTSPELLDSFFFSNSKKENSDNLSKEQKSLSLFSSIAILLIYMALIQ